MDILVIVAVLSLEPLPVKIGVGVRLSVVRGASRQVEFPGRGFILEHREHGAFIGGAADAIFPVLFHSIEKMIRVDVVIRNGLDHLRRPLSCPKSAPHNPPVPSAPAPIVMSFE